MGHAHDHSHPEGRSADRRALGLALILTTGFAGAEVVGGLLTGSLALLADAGHMLSDSLSLALALGAMWLAGRPATAVRTFGLKRAEILAALFNGVTLVAISVWIFIEAYRRLQDPPEVLGGWLLVVAVLGLLVNLAAAAILMRSEGESLNKSAAFRHVLADLAGSVGVIISAVVILLTGWRYVDPLISVGIGLLVVGSSWSILRDATRILLEEAPPGLDADQVGRRLAQEPGVAEVHDLHIWTITSGFPALAAHVLVGRDDDCHAVRRRLEAMLHDDFGIDHTTLQVDHAGNGGLIELAMPQQRQAPRTRPRGTPAVIRRL
ncbi:MAG: cation diffusion facilitator family transporter [Solirubrobacteraceae bacterium MAG38_C4-C5]|nr:cation diffusion facilitator family transporter [Candidatus Siliceabacter maunaloa]